MAAPAPDPFDESREIPRADAVRAPPLIMATLRRLADPRVDPDLAYTTINPMGWGNVIVPVPSLGNPLIILYGSSQGMVMGDRSVEAGYGPIYYTTTGDLLSALRHALRQRVKMEEDVPYSDDDESDSDPESDSDSGVDDNDDDATPDPEPVPDPESAPAPAPAPPPEDDGLNDIGRQMRAALAAYNATAAFVGHDAEGVLRNHPQRNVMATLYGMAANSGMTAMCQHCRKPVLMGKRCCGTYAFD